MKQPLTAAALAALALAAAPAPAPRAAASATDCGTALVVQFVGAYRDAVLGEGPTGRTPSEIRALYLTPELNLRLDRWAERHPAADPVFRGAGVPVRWSAACAADAVDLTQYAADGGTRHVRYRVRLADQYIVGIADPGAADR
ncbi:hypothetical protein OG871_04540 [Kitasatospora sp. NBC_00374]|uniref:hypothetical protein n=1 Tax=Kitasatospora sp. NBC_00374 TaxID=2975964 RepID=UPI0030E52895